jgi:hypothetical protein
VLRWLDAVGLDGLERLVLRSALLRKFVISRHERAFRTMLAAAGPVRSVTIVGGALFPRTAIILSRLLPGASLTVVDAKGEHLDVARSFVGDSVAFRHAVFNPRQAVLTDLVVVPLAYVGDRRVFYESPPARFVLVHDWIWARHPRSVVVSWILLKRLNLVEPSEAVDRMAAIS